MTTPNDKTEFLSRVRQAIRHAPAWHTAPGPILTPAKADGGVRRFEEALTAVGGKVYTPEDDASVVEQILKIAVAHNAHRVGVIAGPATSGLGLEDLLARKGFEVSDVHFQTWLAREGNEEKAWLALEEFLASADMVISGSECAIAETGTLVLQAGPGNPRSATNLPPVHVAVVRPDQIIPTLFDAVSFLRTAAGQASCVTLITGPSRTSDIEQISTIGVHGPGELHVIFRK